MDAIARLMELDNGTMVNAIQAANELPGDTIESRLLAGINEVIA